MTPTVATHRLRNTALMAAFAHLQREELYLLRVPKGRDKPGQHLQGRKRLPTPKCREYITQGVDQGIANFVPLKLPSTQ